MGELLGNVLIGRRNSTHLEEVIKLIDDVLWRERISELLTYVCHFGLE